MINLNKSYSNAKQAVLPILISDYLDICDPVLTFDRFMEEMDLEKYLREIPKHDTGRPGYNPASMLKTVLFGFMTKGYISLRELEDSCKVNLRFMYLMDHETPSYRTFGYFINEVLRDSIEEIACTGTRFCINTEYAPEYLTEAAGKYAQMWQIDETTFVHGRGHHKTMQQRHYEKLMGYVEKLDEYVEKIHICGEGRNSYSKTDHAATWTALYR